MYKTILRKTKMLFGVLLTGMCLSASAQRQVPLVFDKENTGRYAKRVTPYEQLVPQQSLRNPLMWSNGKGLVKNLKQWEKRRNEISASIQAYEIGRKPTVEKSQVKARMSGDTLLVDVTVNGQTLTLSSTIRYPKTGKAPYPLMIGTSGISLPKDLLEKRGIATMVFHENQVNDYSQWRKKHDRGSYEFDRLYPELKENGAYSEWAWGFSRLLDGLQQVGETVSRIDMKHIGVTGCSYAGKMALFCGAFDERVALTIAQGLVEAVLPPGVSLILLTAWRILTAPTIIGSWRVCAPVSGATRCICFRTTATNSARWYVRGPCWCWAIRITSGWPMNQPMAP